MAHVRRCRAALPWGLAGLLLAAGGQAQTAEVEPNHPCAAAQAVAAAGGVFALDGRIDAGDVDFFRVSGPPGSLLMVDLEGAGAGSGTLLDGYLGAFSADCLALLAYDDESGAGSDSRMEVLIPPGGTVVLAATGWPDLFFQGSQYYTGTYRLRTRVEPVSGALSGRLVDAERNDEPVRGAYLYLTRCAGGSCHSYPEIEARSDVDGRFQFLSSAAFPLTGGAYRLVVYHERFEPLVLEQFEVNGRTDVDLGDLALTPFPTIGSVRGRLVDLASRRPLSGTAAPYAEVYLEHCPEEQPWCWFVGWQSADIGGYFHFAGSEYDPLVAGRYRLRAVAEQYVETAGDYFLLGEDEDRDVGDLPVKSIPIRVELAEGCDRIPPQGGRCRFTVQVTNGQLTTLWAEGWAMVSGHLLRPPVGTSAFQLPPRALTLLPGRSTALAFAFDLPADTTEDAAACVTFYAAPVGRPLDVLAAQQLFCVRRTFAGFERLPDAEARHLLPAAETPARPIGGKP